MGDQNRPIGKMYKQINGQYVRCPSCSCFDYFNNGHEMNAIFKKHRISCDVSSFEVVKFVDIDFEGDE